MSSDTADSNERGTYWEGYSNYESVSRRINESVATALDSYSYIAAAHSEGAPVHPQQAAEARASIMAAAMRLATEMEEDRGNVQLYDEILDRWRGTETEDGYFSQFQEVRLQQQSPAWLFSFVYDIRQAAWKLGYVQAGRTQKEDPADPNEAEAEAMLEGI